MSIYRPHASKRIKQASLAFRRELLLSPLMQRIQISILVNVSSVVDVLNLLCRPKRQQTLQLAPLSQLKLIRLVNLLDLVPVSRCVPYEPPFCCSILYYACARDSAGAVTDIISIRTVWFRKVYIPPTSFAYISSWNV